MSINWFPGHMVKARREIQENLKLVDMVVMLLDARAPYSCRNPQLEKMIRPKPTIIVLNKMDLAPIADTRRHLEQLRNEGHLAAAMNSTSGKGSREVLQLIATAFVPVQEDLQRRGRRNRPARVMIVGVPNVGKSSFLNSLAGKKMAVTGARPGVTRGKQWVRVRDDIEFMDTPGLMWPKIDSTEQGLKLALLDIVGEKAYQEYDISIYLIQLLREKAPQVLHDKLKLDHLDRPEQELLEDIARKKGHLIKGGQVDAEKTCTVLLQDFRKGKLGPLSLE
ncbi:MAG: ribosome biogenesis GTPase YlqF [Syntrophomonadaceae bacterium]|nr:ribosome biogenesis GTPase YlqF [Syntrophomonadaceae bacterium]MDD3897872.1 ribosome biogenesis GTPase YlqF [Syntrophomonadaceae bacterium]MDD4561632.1 ribosome biogenesis GTPase YlqF [Syntrophomonadaceae bacterium]